MSCESEIKLEILCEDKVIASMNVFSIPRQGEDIKIDFPNVKGSYRVLRVVHCLSKSKEIYNGSKLVQLYVQDVKEEG